MTGPSTRPDHTRARDTRPHDTQPRAPWVSPAVLVAAALPALTESTLDLSVTQLDRPGLRRAPDRVDTRRSAFTTTTGSWGVEVVTGATSRARSLRALAPGPGATRVTVARRPVVHGRTPDRLDVLVTTRPGEWTPTRAVDAGLGEALSTLVTAARDGGLDVTSVRCPAAGLARDQWRAATTGADQPLEGTDPRLARAFATRVTVALDNTIENDRLGYLAAVLDEADRRGWGVHVADRRYGALTGRWVCLRVLSRIEPEATGQADHTAAAQLVPVTALGPSSRGTAAAFLRWLPGTLVGFAGSAVESVDMLHAIVGVPSSWTREPGRGGRTVLPGVRDHVVRIGPPRPMTDLSVDVGRVPIWMQFEVRDLRDGDREPRWMDDLLEVVARHLPQPPTVEYYSVRWSDARRRVRVERAKLAVKPPPLTSDEADTLDERLLNVCETVQLEWLARVAVGGRAGRAANLRVAPRERWLGTWLDDPA